MEEKFWEEKGIYYRVNNWIPNRLTLVFVHGVSGSSSAWLPYEKIFENKYNVLTYDIRGHGMSKKFPNYSDYSIKNNAEDLYELVSYLNISKFILISNSLGCLIALEYLKHYPETVLGNIFTSPEIYLDIGIKGSILRSVFKIITIFLGGLPFDSKPRGHVDYSKHLNSTDWNVSRNLADLINTTPRAHFYTLRHSFAKNQDYFLENINVPTLVMHGKKDSMIPIKNALAMSNKIRNSEFITIFYVDHNTAHNGVKEISEAIESFIEKNKANFGFS